MNATKINDEIITTDLRKSLKEMIQKEFQQLPETLATLEPKERLNILCKLMPFVLPKVESVNHEQGEPGEFNIKGWR